jgi:hypothetical protein
VSFLTDDLFPELHGFLDHMLTVVMVCSGYAVCCVCVSMFCVYVCVCVCVCTCVRVGGVCVSVRERSIFNKCYFMSSVVSYWKHETSNEIGIILTKFNNNWNLFQTSFRTLMPPLNTTYSMKSFHQSCVSEEIIGVEPCIEVLSRKNYFNEKCNSLKHKMIS